MKEKSKNLIITTSYELIPAEKIISEKNCFLITRKKCINDYKIETDLTLECRPSPVEIDEIKDKASSGAFKASNLSGNKDYEFSVLNIFKFEIETIISTYLFWNNVLDKILNEYTFKNIYIYDNNDEIVGYICDLLQYKQIKYIRHNISIRDIPRTKIKKKSKQIIKIVIIYFLELFNLIKNILLLNKNLILINEHKGNKITDTLVSKLINNKVNILSIQTNPKNLLRLSFRPYYFHFVFKGVRARTNKLEPLEKIKIPEIMINSLPMHNIIQDKVLKLIKSNYSRISYTLKRLEIISKKNNIVKFIQLDERNYFNRFLLLWSKSKGITSFFIQHGLLGKRYIPESDYQLLWSERDKDLMNSNKSYKGTPIVVGNIQFDVLSKYSDADYQKQLRQKISKLLHIKSSKKWVLYATLPRLWSEIENNSFVNFIEILKAFPKDSNYIIIVKIHPIDDEVKYLKLIEEFGLSGYIKVVRWMNSFDLISVSDSIITLFSTIGLEALVIRKPLYIINTNNYYELFDYPKEGFGIRLKTREDITKYIFEKNTKLIEEINEDKLKSFTYKINGNTGERIYQQIISK